MLCSKTCIRIQTCLEEKTLDPVTQLRGGVLHPVQSVTAVTVAESNGLQLLNNSFAYLVEMNK